MRRAGRGANIDVTPLIDILFMLIIFFVLATSFIQGRLTVELPQGDGDFGKADNPILVTLKRGGTLLWGDAPVVSEDLLRLAREENETGKREILIVGDRDASYGEVMELLDTLRCAGMERVGLALQGRGRGNDL